MIRQLRLITVRREPFSSNEYGRSRFDSLAVKRVIRQRGWTIKVVGVVFRLSVRETGLAEHEEWQKLFKGLMNSQPTLFEEWRVENAAAEKRHFRERFGAEGPKMRMAGYRSMMVGGLTEAAIRRFLARLTQALFFKYCGRVLHGIVHIFHVNETSPHLRDGGLRDLLGFVPLAHIPVRSGRSLENQFFYWFNVSNEAGALTALIRFSNEASFHVITVEDVKAEGLKINASGKWLADWQPGMRIPLYKSFSQTK